MAKIIVWVQARPDRPNLSLEWLDPVTGKRRSKSAGTADPADAAERAKDLEYELRHGVHAEPSKMSWPDFVKLYCDEWQGNNRSTSQVKARQVLRDFGVSANVKRLAEVCERTVSRYAAVRRDEGLAPATIAGHLAHVNAALNWALDQKLITSKPKIRPPKYRPKKPRTITREQFDAILERAPDAAWRLFVLVAWYTGMRRGELLALAWDEPSGRPWIDFMAGKIQIPAAWCKADRDDWLPVHPDLLPHLEAARQPSGLLFPFPSHPTETGRRFKAMAAGAGVRATLHDLRRTFGTRYAPVVPAHVLQRLMRHRDIKTTLKFYVDIDGTLEAAIRKA